MLNISEINSVKKKYKEFIDSLSVGDSSFMFTPHSEITPYARCFAIFGYHLLLDNERLFSNADTLALAVREDLDLVRGERKKAGVCLRYDKPYLQLLAFSLSALSVLDRLQNDSLEDHVLPLLSNDIKTDLLQVGAFDGVPRSGNQAMFMAIILCHAQKYLNVNVDNLIEDWQKLHTNSLNQFGFWGSYKTMSHLQFQNGYHQYEAMDYFQTKNVPWNKAADNVAILADNEGHFAPYPGGGGCYDYDAIYILTAAGSKAVTRHRDLLMRTAKTILAKQNTDGGFCESVRVRPRTIDNLLRSARHVFSAHGAARVERLRQSITLLRPKHNHIHTHWSEYSRRWDESDLWDSWFRMLTVARIDVALDPKRISEWGFIDYPGIGFHSLLRHK